MYKHLINKTLSFSRPFKFLIIFLIDLLIILTSTYMSLAIRLDEFNLLIATDTRYLVSIQYFLIPIFVFFILAIIFKFYDSSYRYYNLGNNSYYVLSLFSIITILLNFFLIDHFSYGAIIINILLIFLLIFFSRKLISQIYFFHKSELKTNSIIVCSSKNLHKLYQFVRLNQKTLVKALLINDIDKIDFKRYGNYKIANIKLVGEICKKYNIKEIYSDKYYKNFTKEKLNKTVIKIFQTDNLFANSEIDIKQQFVEKYFNMSDKIGIKTLNYYYNKTILITGAGGSIGKSLFFELINSKAKKIIIIEQDELKLFNLKREYENITSKNSKDFQVSFKLGNLSNDLFLKNIFLDEKKIDYVLHAAAYKHVGFGEENIFSFVKNNVFVTHNLAKISIEKKVKKFIFISTDKAVNPKSVMGYTKNICEKILIFLNKKHNLKNIFKIVRFGNVINSDGSVLPIFEKQILSGGPVTVTHKDVTRYFMSIKNASQLVLNTIAINKKIGIFILDMGKPYKILDIANSMINFYLKKNKITNKQKIIFIGLQKGEKIHEELILGKNLVKTKIKNILAANEKINTSLDYSKIITKLKSPSVKNDKKKLLHQLKYYA